MQTLKRLIAKCELTLDAVIVELRWTAFYESLNESGPAIFLKLGDWVEEFGANPTLLPSDGLPPEVPLLSWRTDDGSTFLDVAEQSATFRLLAQIGQPLQPSSRPPRFAEIIPALGVRPYRFGNIRRVAIPREDAAPYLIRKFANEWAVNEPFRNSRNFQVHNSKRYTADGWGSTEINSWVKLRSGELTGPGTQIRSLIIEQDINTPSESKDKTFSGEEFEQFADMCEQEFKDIMLNIYFPDEEIRWVTWDRLTET